MRWRQLVAVIVSGAAMSAAAYPARAAQSTPSTMFAYVGSTPTGLPIQPSFLGLSVEFQALERYGGADPAAIDPVLEQLIRNLSPGQPPVLRIGGHSTDTSWWPTRGMHPGKGVRYALGSKWARGVRALASTLGARLILGVNMAAGQPALAAAEARALIRGVGAENIAAFELGNEPDLYGRIAWYHDAAGRPHLARKSSWSLHQFIKQFSLWRSRLPSALVAGPAFGNLPWMSGLGSFLADEPGLGLVTFHRYPLRGCLVGPDSPSYPTIDHLLSDYSSGQLAAALAPFVQDAHAAGLRFRVDEMNSVACAGRPGVSDTFASALWALDTLFDMAAVGVDGVNIHTLPGAAYELFKINHAAGAWSAVARPEYYGLLMFEQAAPAGARLLPVYGLSGQVKGWATVASDRTRRVVLINEDTAGRHYVILHPPGSASRASLELLSAPSAAATSDVSLGGQTVGADGELASPPRSDFVTGLGGYYGIALPPASAVLLTFA